MVRRIFALCAAGSAPRPLRAWLDPEAVKALQEWRFNPGTLMGEPVPVMVNVEFSFTLR